VIDGAEKRVVVGKIFDNADFGYNKITVERPLRLNFQAAPERISRLDDLRAFQKIAESDKKNQTIRSQEIEAGIRRQEAVKAMLLDLAEATNETVFKERAAFVQQVKAIERKSGVLLGAPELKAVLEALSEKDETAEICRDSKGKPEPDSDLRDTENVPLKEDIEEYFAREVLPHVPDAWIDHRKTKTGYEIPLNRHFYRYEPPRPLEEIAADVKGLESEILSLLAEITGNGAGAR